MTRYIVNVQFEVIALNPTEAKDKVDMAITERFSRCEPRVGGYVAHQVTRAVLRK